MKVNSLKTVKRTDNWRICLYGDSGVGKTSSVKLLKGKTLIFAFDNSTKVLGGLDIDVIDFDQLNPVQNIKEFMLEVKELTKGYDNLVLDNVSALEKAWFTEQAKKSKSGIRNELQDYSGWTNYFLRFISAVYILPINILVTAWADEQKVTTLTGQTFNQYVPEIRSSVRNTFMGLTDIVGRVVINPKTHGRGVILEGDDSVFAKNRLDQRTVAPIEELFNFETEKTNKKEEKAGNK